MPWVIVLTAGTTDRFQLALDGARRLAPVAQVRLVVAEDHPASSASDLAPLERHNLIVEPRSRGTAAGVLLALIHALKSDHAATIVVLPVSRSPGYGEELEELLSQAVAAVRADPDFLVLVRHQGAPDDFIFAAAGRTLLFQYGTTMPELLDPFLRELVVRPEENGLANLYEKLPSRDFSRDLLARAHDRLRHLTIGSRPTPVG
jgi:hypothetical protein